MSDTPRTLVERLRSFAEAYPEDIFIPLTAEETKTHSSIVTRASGGMGRHFAPFATEAADEIERLRGALRELVAALDQHENEWAMDRVDAAVAAARIVLAQPKELTDNQRLAQGEIPAHLADPLGLAQPKEPT